MTLTNSHDEFMAEVQQFIQVLTDIGSPSSPDDNAVTDPDIKERDGNLRETLRVLGNKRMILEERIKAEEAAGTLTNEEREALAKLLSLMQHAEDNAIKVIGSVKNAN
jgi:hypothetical protein